LYLAKDNNLKTWITTGYIKDSADKKGKVLHEGRELKISNGELTDDYKPFDVHI